jgi:hypothetical protein
VFFETNRQVLKDSRGLTDDARNQRAYLPGSWNVLFHD